jgi:precorrin-2 dehydrogenase/sirohydrochlorin ferrochelatase
LAYFPAFLKFDNRKVLLVGGGNIALEKLEKLVDFTHDITVISKAFNAAFLDFAHQHQISCYERAYETGDIAGYFCVIVAVDDLEVQKSIYEESQSIACLCNSVDSVKYCDFIFPSYVKKEHLTIAISTSGTSPAMAKYLKQYIASMLPENISSFLAKMKALRQELPKGKERMMYLDQRAKAYMKRFFKDVK